MESREQPAAVTFLVLQARLLRFVSTRVDRGDFTERGLARVLGVSQPQVHNVLKGKRRLQIALADRMMQRLSIDVLDLIEDRELRARLVGGANL